MSYRPYYKKGDWSAVCDSCGFVFKASQLKERWDGLKVCHVCWEPRQPQDFVRGVAEHIAPPWTRPEQQDIFFSNPYVCWTKSAVPSFAIPGCMIPGNTEMITYQQIFGSVPASTFDLTP